jgi:hypothetical protein
VGRDAGRGVERLAGAGGVAMPMRALFPGDKII